jgi:hypothetical protein
MRKPGITGRGPVLVASAALSQIQAVIQNNYIFDEQTVN